MKEGDRVDPAAGHADKSMSMCSTRPFCHWCCGGAALAVVPFSEKKAFISPLMSFMSKSATNFLEAKPISTTSCFAAASRLEVRFLR
eukprot:2790948-Ditylum_brightwellii.AAC.1